MNIYRFLLVLTMGIQIPLSMHADIPMPIKNASRFFQKMYWHEQVARLSAKKQTHGWLLQSLIKHMNKPEQPIAYTARFCWDILLKVHNKEKRQELVKRLQLLIDNYNAHLQTPIQEKYTKQLMLFNKRHGFASKQTNAVLNSLRIQAHDQPLESRAQKVITPAIVIAGIAGVLIVGKYAVNLLQHLFPGQSEQEKYTLPKDLENLKHCTIIQIKALPQTGVSCGYHTAFNAHAIDALLQQGKKIDPKDIQTQTGQLLGFIENGNDLQDLEIMYMAKQMGLENFNLLTMYPKSQALDLTIPKDDKDFEKIDTNNPNQIKTLDNVIQQIKNSPHGIFHFACHLYEPPFLGLGLFKKMDHWVLISLIKQVGQKPQMIYVDSKNTPLSNDNAAYNFLTSLYNKLFT